MTVFDGIGRVPVVQYGWVHALLLPAGGDVVVQSYWMSCHWRTQPTRWTVVVQVAREVRLDGRPLSTFLDERPLASASPAVVFDCEYSRAGCQHWIGASRVRELPSPFSVTYEGVERLEVEVELDTRSPFE